MSTCVWKVIRTMLNHCKYISRLSLKHSLITPLLFLSRLKLVELLQVSRLPEFLNSLGRKTGKHCTIKASLKKKSKTTSKMKLENIRKSGRKWVKPSLIRAVPNLCKVLQAVHFSQVQVTMGYQSQRIVHPTYQGRKREDTEM